MLELYLYLIYYVTHPSQHDKPLAALVLVWGRILRRVNPSPAVTLYTRVEASIKLNKTPLKLIKQFVIVDQIIEFGRSIFFIFNYILLANNSAVQGLSLKLSQC